MTMKKFKTLSFREKADYILFDFSWQIILGGILLFLIGSWIYLDYMVEPPALQVEMIGVGPDAEESNAFNGFLEAQGMDYENDRVKLSKVIQPGEKSRLEISTMNHLLLLRAAEGKTDLYFWDDADAENALRFDLVDLRTVLPMETLEACADRLVYNGPLLQGGYPCAIRLTDCSWVEENGFYEDCVVGISRSVQDPELVSQFIKYIT